MIPDEAGPVLLARARDAIEECLAFSPHPIHHDPSGGPAWLHEPGASFVTLTRAGELRGCIGSLSAWRPLGQDVAENAVAAAVRDPRFPPVQPGELAGIRIEVSVLSAPEPLTVRDEADARHRLRPGIDGVVLSAGGRRATFLPQVWQALPEPRDFLNQLKRKAGLPESSWAPDTRLERYTVQQWSEPA